MKYFGIIMEILNTIAPDQKKEVIDTLLDEIEKRNTKHTTVMALCRTARILTGVPDDDIDQKNPV